MARSTFPARAAALVLGLGVALALAAPAGSTPPTALTARAASLAVSPANGGFTAGQQLTFTGNLGPSGKVVQLQSNMGRPGDVWRDVPGATGRTNASGSFTIRTQAPSMYGIRYRAVAGSRTTPTWTSQVRHQEVSVTAETDRTDLGWGQGLAGYPLTLTASTAAMPLIPGRGLSLQQRVGTGWTTVATGAVGPEGTATFVVTPSAPGTLVYRVRLEDWDSGVGHVGWFPSYPLYVDVLATPPVEPERSPAPRDRPVAPAGDARVAPVQTTAAATNRWGVQRFDFDWEHGESLTDKASIGTRRRGRWLDAADGGGRVALRNGALQLSSAPEGGASRGSLWATLQGNAQPYGRWETRVMPMTFGGAAVDYRIRAELVPDDPAAQRCGGPGITLFDVAPSQSQVLIGARSAGTQWTRTVPGVTIAHAFHAYAVEVTPKRITWFVDGKAVGRVTDRSAISGQPLTVRLTMQASGAEPMRTTRTLVDWVRAYPSGTGRRTKGGVRLTTGTYAPTC